MTKKTIISLSVVVIIFSGFFLLRKFGFFPLTDEAILTSADEIFKLQFQDYGNNSTSLSKYRGKPLVVNSWAAWCPFCKKELVDFATAQKEFKNRVVIIAIDRAESLAIAKKYSDELGVTNELIFLLDPSDSFYKSIGDFSMPETIFIDSNGAIVFPQPGPLAI